MNESKHIRMAGWAGVVGIVLLVGSGVFWGLATFNPTWNDATILDQVNGNNEQGYSYVSYTLLGPSLALLLWFATGLRRVLEVRAGSARLAAVVVPGMVMFAALTFAGVALDLSSTIAGSWTGRFVADADTVRALDVASYGIATAGLVGAGALVAATSRVIQATRSASAAWAWIGYVVAFVCVFGFWAFGLGTPLFVLWLLGACIGVIRAAGKIEHVVTMPTAEVPAQAAPSLTEDAERTEPKT